jgi:hypothetical protein
MSDLEQLGQLVAGQQDMQADRAFDLDVEQRRFLSTAARPRRPRLVLLAAACAAAVALASVLLFTLRPDRTVSPLTFRVGDSGRPGEVDAWLAAPSAAALPLRFSDGTAMSLAPSARARVTKIESTGATLLVESGRAEVAVAKRKGASWQISLGPFRVDVTGTKFDVAFDPVDERLALTMHEGSVVVSGCVFGTGRSFVGGDTVRASCRERKVDIAPSAPIGSAALEAGPAGASSSEHEEPLPPSDAPVVPAPAAKARAEDPAVARSLPGDEHAADWRELVKSGSHRAAMEAAEAAGFADQCAQASADDLVALGDAARYSGRVERAAEAYGAVRRRFPGHERAAVAAFSLGRLAQDQRADYGTAARWFRTYLAERPVGRLARDAQGRVMESLHRAGDAAGARRGAKAYLARHAEGPHAEIARSLLAE